MQKKVNVRKIAMTAILSAVATVLMFLSFSLPIVPSFLAMDFSELPALIASFSMGPVIDHYRSASQGLRPRTAAHGGANEPGTHGICFL